MNSSFLPAARSDARLALRSGAVMQLMLMQPPDAKDIAAINTRLALILGEARAAGVKPRLRVKAPSTRF